MGNNEANKMLACKFLALVSEHQIEELSKMIAPTWTMYGGPPGLPSGEEGLRALFQTFGQIEQQWTIEDVLAEGEKVAVRATNSCLQDNFLGVPAHGRRQTFTATFIFHIENGKVVTVWRNADDLGRLLQLGARIEPPSQE
jgi:predicted ester cyclase